MTSNVEILGEEMIKERVDWARAIEATKRAFRAHAQVPEAADQLTLRSPNRGEIHIKGAHLSGSKWVAVKAAAGFPLNRQRGIPSNDGFTAVFCAETGHLRALLLDHGWLTEIRTGAAGAIAADVLARRNARAVGILGSGVQARFQLAALVHVRHIDRVVLWSRNQDHAQQCAEDIRAQHGLEVEVTEEPEDAVTANDILVTTTSARSPLVEKDWLRPGLHITALGADQSDKQELHSNVLEAADRVVADDVTNCLRLGELHHAVAQSGYDPTKVDGLGELLTGLKPGRESDDEITIADLCGLGIQDAAMADLVLSGENDASFGATERQGRVEIDHESGLKL